MNLYKECTEKSYSFLVIDNTLVSDKSFTFQKESYRKNIKTNNEIDDKIRDKKLQYDINRKAAKIPASGKIDKHEDFTGKEILPPHQKRVIEQAEFILL